MKIFILIFSLLLSMGLAMAEPTTKQLTVPSCGPPQVVNETGIEHSVAGQMWCVDFVPCQGITNATQLMFFFSNENPAACTPTSCSLAFAIYTDGGDGGYEPDDSKVMQALLTYNDTVESTPATITGISSFSLTAGQLYRFCWCAKHTSTTGGEFVSMPGTASDTYFDEWTSAFGKARQGIATNGCDITGAATPPSSTGSLTTQATGLLPPYVELGTSSP